MNGLTISALKLAKSMNDSLTLFLKDLLPLGLRVDVFHLLHLYTSGITADVRSPILLSPFPSLAFFLSFNFFLLLYEIFNFGDYLGI